MHHRVHQHTSYARASLRLAKLRLLTVNLACICRESCKTSIIEILARYLPDPCNLEPIQSVQLCFSGEEIVSNQDKDNANNLG